MLITFYPEGKLQARTFRPTITYILPFYLIQYFGDFSSMIMNSYEEKSYSLLSYYKNIL